MITVTSKGDFAKTFNFLNSSKDLDVMNIMDKYGREGVSLLSANTPVDTGKTSESWTYKIERTKGKTSINWYNTNVVEGVNIAIILQYGHGTQNGGYITGKDYINPVLKPLFEKMSNELWKAVNKL